MPAQKEQQKVFQSMNDYLEQISKKVCRIEDAVVNDVEKRLEDRRAQKLRDDEQKKQADTQSGSFNLIVEKPSIMKRPVITKENHILTIGFNELIFSERLL